MICDHASSILIGVCHNTPARAPRLVVPSQTPFLPMHFPLKRFTTMHFCELHKGELKAADLLNGALKRNMESDARRLRPAGFKCDFEKATLDYVLTSTPEYRRFLALLGSRKIAEIALGRPIRIAG